MRPAMTPLPDKTASRLVPRSLNSRVFAVYGLTLVLFFSVALAMFFVHEYDQQVDTTQMNSVMLIEVVNQAVQESAVIGDYDSVTKTLAKAVQGSVFASASFIDLQGGKIVVDSRDPVATLAPNWLVEHLRERLQDVNRVVSVGGKDYGIVRLRFDVPKVASDLWTLLMLASGAALVMLVLGLVPMRVLLRRWLASLDRLQAFEAAMAAGTFDPAQFTDDNAPAEISRLLGMLRRTADLVREREASRRALDNQKFALDQHAIVSITDLDGNITYANDRFCEITGYTREELLGRNHRVINSSHQPKEFFDNLWSTISGGGVWRGEICNRKRTGELYWVNATILALLGDDGKPEQYIAIRTDITDRKAAEALLQQSKESAEQANQAKSQFLANMSHEIRTPLNAVLGMLRLLHATPLSARQVDYVSKSEGAARSLLLLLNDILDFSKVEADKMTLDVRAFRIDHLMRELSVILSSNVGDKPVEVLFDIDPEVPGYLMGDDLRLQQVLINLGGNAIKFTEQGEVVIGVRVGQRSAEGVTLLFSVQDTGIGIAPEQRARIFSGFSQAEASTTRRFGGTGLGLAICQRLVGLMGGSIEVDSEAGRGSNFRFGVRFALAPGEPELESAALAASMTGLRTLVVDDNATARVVLSKMVRALGWQVDVAGDVAQAIAMTSQREAAGEVYDVVFIDGQLQGMDNWSASQKARARLRPQPAVVMVVNAQAREALTQRSRERRSTDTGAARNAGPTARQRFLVKPVTTSMLIDAVADARQGGTGERRRPSEPAPPTGCLEGLHLLIVEDNANNRQVAQELLMAEGAKVALAENGEQGVRAVFEATPPFDAVLMDIQMPVMDGFTATARIRERSGFETLPIIAMTANVMASDRQACLDAGMSSHVGKPFDLNDLVSALLLHTDRPAAQVVLPSTATAPPTGLPDERQLGGLEVSAAIRRLGGNAPVYARMLRSFLKDLPQYVDQAEQQTLAADWPAALMSMHALKGLAATVGARELQSAAALAEATFGRPPVEGVARELIARVRVLAESLRTQVGPWAAGFALDTEASSAPLGAAMPLRASLQALLDALSRSDMHALDLLEPLRADPALRSLPQWLALEAAVDALDFDRAAALCVEWLRGLPA